MKKVQNKQKENITPGQLVYDFDTKELGYITHIDKPVYFVLWLEGTVTIGYNVNGIRRMKRDLVEYMREVG